MLRFVSVYELRSDTESGADAKMKKFNIGISLSNLFKTKQDKNADNGTNGDEKKDADDDEAAPSETTVVIEDETPKKVRNEPSEMLCFSISADESLRITVSIKLPHRDN